jgi:DNA recombination protein RmuC
MIVRLPGGGTIVVDSKVAFDAYLAATESDGDREVELKRHADLVEAHYKKLSAKRYWEQFDRTPKLVVMFMPLESALVAALDLKPNLHATAMQHDVLIATPTLLVAMLRAIAYGWQQEAVADNARQIAECGRDMYDRLGKFVEHFERVGSALQTAGVAYDDAIGSLERRLLPSARQLKDLKATTAEDIETPAPVKFEPRPVMSAELKPLRREGSLR